MLAQSREAASPQGLLSLPLGALSSWALSAQILFILTN